MSQEERISRAEQIERIVRENDVEKWLTAQSADIAEKQAADRRRRARTRQ
jgi:trehalose-6-phosphate synthase